RLPALGYVVRLEAAQERHAVFAEQFEVALEHPRDDAGVAPCAVPAEHLQQCGVAVAEDADLPVELDEALQHLLGVRLVTDRVAEEDDLVVAASLGVKEDCVESWQVGVNVAQNQVAHLPARISAHRRRLRATRRQRLYWARCCHRDAVAAPPTGARSWRW